MFLRAFLVTMVLALPAWAQVVVVPDCTVDVTVAKNLKLDVVYRCRSTTALTFAPDDQEVAAHVSGNRGKIEPVNGIVEARYRFDLADYARAVNSPAAGVKRGEAVLAPIRRLAARAARLRAPAGDRYPRSTARRVLLRDRPAESGRCLAARRHARGLRGLQRDRQVHAGRDRRSRARLLRPGAAEGGRRAAARHPRRLRQGQHARPGRLGAPHRARPSPTTGRDSRRSRCWSGWCRCARPGVGYRPHQCRAAAPR